MCYADRIENKGYRFYFFSNESNEPMHVHVEKAGSNGKIWLEPRIESAYFYGFSNKQVNEIAEIIEEHLETLKSKWNDFFGE